MQGTTRIILPRKFWQESSDKQELKQKISNYMAVCYPGYTVREIGKYYAICDINR